MDAQQEVESASSALLVVVAEGYPPPHRTMKKKRTIMVVVLAKQTSCGCAAAGPSRCCLFLCSFLAWADWEVLNQTIDIPSSFLQLSKGDIAGTIRRWRLVVAGMLFVVFTAVLFVVYFLSSSWFPYLNLQTRTRGHHCDSWEEVCLRFCYRWLKFKFGWFKVAGFYFMKKTTGNYKGKVQTPCNYRVKSTEI